MNRELEKSLRIEKIEAEHSLNSAHFFNSSQFLLSKNFKTRGWQLVKSIPVAQVFFYVEGNSAISGYESTFGSIDADTNLTIEELIWFIQSLKQELKKLGVRKIEIKNYPNYFNNATKVENALIRCGFQIDVVEVDQFIIVGNKSFYEVANRSEVRRSDKCEELGALFRIASISELPQIYNLVKKTLQRKGNCPSMEYEELEKAITSCPDNYLLFTLWDGETLMAATVSVAVTDSILYNFYHADHLDYRKASAFTHLLKNIYTYCWENKLGVLDLGISSINGVLNEGLYNFKKSRGAVTADKKNFKFHFS